MGNIAERFKLKNAVVKKSLTKPLVEGIPEEMLDRSAGNDTSTTVLFPRFNFSLILKG